VTEGHVLVMLNYWLVC